jgi:hypothetical protein
MNFVSTISKLPYGPVALTLVGLVLSGCADIGDTYAEILFSDPATYELMNCTQLDAARQSLAVQNAEMQRVMTKAETGVAGPVVVELAYRNDWLKIRGQTRRVEEAWQRAKCATPAAPKSAASFPSASPPLVKPESVVVPVPSAKAIY